MSHRQHMISGVHYRVGQATVFSELAAKTSKQRSRPLANWLRNNVTGRDVLDYGCGRLRYSGILAKQSVRLHLLDSRAQLSRLVHFGRIATTVAKYAREEWKNARVYELESYVAKPIFDFILCANVLSAIPVHAAVLETLTNIRRSLRPNGRALIVNQHTNSFFSDAKTRPGARPHLYGTLRVWCATVVERLKLASMVSTSRPSSA